MRILLSVLIALTTNLAQADTFTLYLVEGDPHLVDGLTDEALLKKICSNKFGVIKNLIKTDSASPQGTNQTYSMDYVEEWDDAGNPKSRASRDVGTKFRIQEKGDSIKWDFSTITFDGWVSYESKTPKPLDQPIFSVTEGSGQLKLKKGGSLVIGAPFTREEIQDGVPLKIMKYMVIERKL